MHGLSPPSPWLTRWGHLLPAGARVLDVACGGGRHLHWLTRQGFAATGIDRDTAALALAPPGARTVCADIEGGLWPLAGEQFGGVLVFNYLWRPLWPALRAALAPGGVLIHETFADGNQTVGRPARPDFLLQPGELIERCAGLRIVAYEHGFLDEPARFVQRIVAVQPEASADPASPARHLLAPSSS